jgi:polyhydroxyalkanoate synthesis regulator phasin
MNSDTVAQFVQKGFRVGLGATTSLVEGLQNPQQLEQDLSRLRANPSQFVNQLVDQASQRVDELEAKGTVTEREARSVVDRFWAERTGTVPPSEMTIVTRATPVSPDVQAEIQDLTAQLAALRAELGQLRNGR